jgi:hypothetical protein
MAKNYADINYDIHDDVELTAETVVPAEDGCRFFAEPYGEPCDGPPAVTKIPVMSDMVAALYMLTESLAVAFDMGMMTRDEVEWVLARVAKAAARRGR